MTQSGAWAYLAVFLLMALAFIGIPGPHPAGVMCRAGPEGRLQLRPAAGAMTCAVAGRRAAEPNVSGTPGDQRAN
jgi:hypothetical protein